jgi:hypothetical protein
MLGSLLSSKQPITEPIEPVIQSQPANSPGDSLYFYSFYIRSSQ